MNWETGEEDGSGWTGLAPTKDPEEEAFNQGVKSVITIRCMNHRAVPQINKAETLKAECGECVRQQCWKDMLRLIAKCIEHTPLDANGRETLAALEESLLVDGIGTFGVADEMEKAFANSNAE